MNEEMVCQFVCQLVDSWFAYSYEWINLREDTNRLNEWFILLVKVVLFGSAVAVGDIESIGHTLCSEVILFIIIFHTIIYCYNNIVILSNIVVVR